MSEQAKFQFGGKETHESEPLVGTRQPSAYTSLKPNLRYRSGNKLWIGIIAGIMVVVAIVILIIAISVGTANAAASGRLEQSINIENLMAHLQGLEDIAKDNSNSRAVMFGYNASADMVYDKLSAAGYNNVTKQMFEMATYEDLGGHTFSANVPVGDGNYTFEFVQDDEFRVMRYSAATGDDGLTAALAVVTSCNESEFITGQVALVNYGICSTVFDLARMAKQAGSAGLIVTRTEGDSNRNSPINSRIFRQSSDSFEIVDLPMIGVSYQTGRKLSDFAASGAVDVSLTIQMTVTFYTTYNILAYTNGGYQDSIIVMGSHLDSVPAGPGINDNGSGSMANLEIALQLIGHGTEPINKVLFAFWGAEEWGLLGSNHFVSSLSTAAKQEIALNLNFDMIGSPNYIRQVYNGSGAENQEVVEASSIIQKLFEQRFNDEGLLFQLAPFTGRSDYGPFIEDGVDIPAGGLATGADETKTDETRRDYGGLAGAILDPCYHQSCDTTDNVDQEAYEQMSQAAAYVLNELMMKEDLRVFLNPSDFKFSMDNDKL